MRPRHATLTSHWAFEHSHRSSPFEKIRKGRRANSAAATVPKKFAFGTAIYLARPPAAQETGPRSGGRPLRTAACPMGARQCLAAGPLISPRWRPARCSTLLQEKSRGSRVPGPTPIPRAWPTLVSFAHSRRVPRAESQAESPPAIASAHAIAEVAAARDAAKRYAGGRHAGV